MRFLLLFQFILISNLCISQTLIIDDSVVLKKGIYRSFNEFKFNNPSLPLNYAITNITNSTGKYIFNNSGVTLFELKVPEDEADKVGEVFGFCDGNDVYINPSLTKYSKRSYFYKLATLGLYCYFDCAYLEYTKYGSSLRVDRCALSINTGEVKDNLRKKSELKELFGNDDEILNSIENFKGFGIKEWNDFCKYCVSRYSEKHKEQINRNPGKMSFEVLYYLKTDSTFQKYYDRIVESLSPFWKIKLTSSVKKNGIPSYRGMNAQKSAFEFPRIGLWQYFYNDGKLKEEIFYNLVGEEIERKEYDTDGKLIIDKNISVQ